MKTSYRYAAGMLACALFLSRAGAQTPPAPQDTADSNTVIRTETRVVLVDTVVTDKKGAYVQDLKQKDFKVYEDNKEQTITSFSFLADPSTPADAQRRYLVLFFDNSTVSANNQVYARQAAAKFIDANAAPNRQIAIVEFSGTLRVTQNFTDDADRLKKVVSGVKLSVVAPNDASMPPAFTNFSTRTVLGALRDMAKGLAHVPGRKTLVFLSAGFPVTQENTTDVTATIDACNRANVAIYPIDVRGLVTPGMGMLGPGASGLAALQAALLTGPFGFQIRSGPSGGSGSSGGKGGGSSGGGTTGGTTGGGTTGGRPAL